MKGRVLIVAGSDSSGGAGIQADIKTVTALGGYAATAITALTAQSTLAVTGVMPVPADFVRQQMEAVLGDIGADVVKIGMLHDGAIARAVADVLAGVPSLPLVLDPVMRSTSGTPLLDEDGVAALKALLLPHATVLTPNLPEAAALLGRSIDAAEVLDAAAALRALGPRVVVLKGGHGSGAIVRDAVAEGGAAYLLESPRVETRHTHGTGCTLASAIATGVAQGLGMRAAIERAHRFVQAAIRAAPGYGKGQGTLNHALYTTER